MPISVPLEKVQDILAASLVKVLDTMAGISCQNLGCESYKGKKVYSPEISGNSKTAQSTFAASVGFAGDIAGVCYLFMGEAFATETARKITGLDAEDLDGEIIRDVCGELTNMFAGTFKNDLADLGMPSTLTIPTVAQGKRLAISTAGASQQFRFSFEANGHQLFADLLLSEAL